MISFNRKGIYEDGLSYGPIHWSGSIKLSRTIIIIALELLEILTDPSVKSLYS